MPDGPARIARASTKVADSLRESFFRTNGIGKLVGLLLGSIAAVLLLGTGDAESLRYVAMVFSVALILMIALFVIVRAQKNPYRFGWGLPVIVLLGFGLGALVYRYRAWLRWLWNRALAINEPYEWALAALFLIGIMLGAFIVRIWPKDQEGFIKGLSGILGGTIRGGSLCEDV